MRMVRVRLAAACVLTVSMIAPMLPSLAQVASVPAHEPDMSLAALADLGATLSDVRTLYGGKSSYVGVANFWEEKLSGRIGPRNAFGGEAIVEALGDRHETFRITYTGVPRNACIRLAARNPHQEGLRTFIDRTEGPFTVESATGMCRDGATLAWVHG